MTFNPRWMNVVRVVTLCCLLSGCGGAQKSEVINPKQRFDVARAAEASGNMGMARSMYEAAAAETTGDRTMQLHAAEGLIRSGAMADGIVILQTLVKQAPNDIDVRRTLGQAQIMNGSPAQAVDTLSVVLASRPDDDTARINKAVALDMLRRHTEAQQLYRDALTRNPSDVEAGNDLALSLMLSGDNTGAKAVVAPFRGRGDLPERMRTTIGLVDGSLGATTPSAGHANTPAIPVAPPTSLKVRPPPNKKTVKLRPAHASDDHTQVR
jgi:Flp pilus assembly protein TadD